MILKNIFNNYKNDMISGLTTATIALPQNMAYALILGINPIYGIYASIFSMLTASIFNFSSYVIVGPTNMMAVALFSSLSNFQGENYLQTIFLTTFLIGLFQFLLVSFNLSELIKYVSHPVIVALSHGAAVLILFSQIENFTGVNVSGSNVITKGWRFIKNLEQINFINLGVGFLTLILIYLIPQIKKELPEYLLTVIIMTIFTAVSGLNSSISLVGEIPKRIIDFNLINFDWHLVGQLYSKAFSIALLGLIQTMAVLQAISLKTDEEPDFDREFRSQGISNMVISFFSAFAISASFSNTFANLSAGARHRISQFFCALSIIIFILFFRPLLAYIPVAVLAGLVIAAAAGIADFKEVIKNMKTTKGDALIFWSTFTATIVLPNLDQAIYFGVMVSLVVVLQISKKADIEMLYYDKKEGDQGYHLHHAHHEEADESEISAKQARVVDLKGAVHFSAADDLKDQLEEFFAKDTDFIIRFRNVRRIDITIIGVLEEFIDQVQASGGEVMLTGVNEKILKMFRKIGLADKVGENNIYLPETEYFAATNKALNYSNN
ncbi:SulP family sulfate permease [Halanaerobium saccharolyticum]|uniref:SulP family sulfate permease n=1 Tax=Halanaerobium saccharolyticum TaxID=43595 RepID=A0A4R7Z8J6_9FIRM|nr:SulP family inorganic anion transporter [Halanaerobium saccharolyticum]RAK11726.1 SulP family sulfate permease [Halanaerobium saccharolyticum]TDW07567.1 SulP family sulfate permease [Halanaerobium saccharolyticum]TDX64488.1 SulP family sulfate permease [Halanaerobium saccharolyticum]